MKKNRLLTRLTAFFVTHREYGAVFIRVAFGIHLIRASYHEMFSLAAQREFAAYLATLGIPFPLLGAYLCHIAEFGGGIALILGLFIRPACFVLVLNFLVAVFVAQSGKPYREQFQAIHILAVALFGLFNGAGALSVDRFLAGRRVPTGNGLSDMT